MHLVLMMMTWAQAATIPFCAQDLSDVELPLKEGSYWLPKNFHDGALRPGFVRLRDDVCRCLPRRERHWPAAVTGYLWVQPNKGAIRIEYVVDGEDSPRIERIRECMGEPQFTVEPMPYKSDIIYTDGREETLPRYPILLHLKQRTAAE